jgi:hypothetical protein
VGAVVAGFAAPEILYAMHAERVLAEEVSVMLDPSVPSAIRYRIAMPLPRFSSRSSVHPVSALNVAAVEPLSMKMRRSSPAWMDPGRLTT